MEVAVIAMSREEAQIKLDAWRQEKHADVSIVREDCIKGYEALAEGKTLLHLDAAIREGGFHTSGFPKLAIARAIYVYRRRDDLGIGSMHVCGRGKGRRESGRYFTCSYSVLSEQPSDDQVRNTAAWQAWATAWLEQCQLMLFDGEDKKPTTT